MTETQLAGRIAVATKIAVAGTLLAVFMDTGGACRRSIVENPVTDTLAFESLGVLCLALFVVGLLAPISLLRRRVAAPLG